MHGETGHLRMWTAFIGNTFRYAHGDRGLADPVYGNAAYRQFLTSQSAWCRHLWTVTAERRWKRKIWEGCQSGRAHGLCQQAWLFKMVEDNEELKHLLYLDLDNFKFVNDTYGHKAGDEALIRLADCIRNVFPGRFCGPSWRR